MNTPLEKELLQTLEMLSSAVRNVSASGTKPDFLPLFAKLDDLSRGLPRDTDPALLHYMHKKSYEKARLLLLGRDSENQAGSCRHV